MSHKQPEKKPPTVICVKKKELKKIGFDDFKHWNQNSNHIYILEEI